MPPRLLTIARIVITFRVRRWSLLMCTPAYMCTQPRLQRAPGGSKPTGFEIFLHGSCCACNRFYFLLLRPEISKPPVSYSRCCSTILLAPSAASRTGNLGGKLQFQIAQGHVVCVIVRILVQCSAAQCMGSRGKKSREEDEQAGRESTLEAVGKTSREIESNSAVFSFCLQHNSLPQAIMRKRRAT